MRGWTVVALVVVLVLSLAGPGTARAGAATCEAFTGTTFAEYVQETLILWAAGVTWHSRGVMVGPLDTTDPRVSGVVTIGMDVDWMPTGGAVLHGSWTDASAAGAWEGHLVGSIAPDGWHDVDVVATSRTGLAGLRLWTHAVGYDYPFEVTGRVCQSR